MRRLRVRDPERILVLQTAFLGDAILTLPLVQALKKIYPHCEIDMMVIPQAANALRNHPDITRIIEYDKRKTEAGFGGIRTKIRELRKRNYNVAIVPHRSLRSALIVYFAAIPARIGFTTSAGKMFFTRRIQYHKDHHEYRRDLDLLEGIGKEWKNVEYPRLFPSADDRNTVQHLLYGWSGEQSPVVGMAPGSVWNTKRWLPERFAEVAKAFAARKYVVALIGGKEDKRLCEDIRLNAGTDSVRSFAGKLSVLESAELIRRCSLLISNDSAPVHMAVGVGTPVAAIFGPTVPAFGFAPYGTNDKIVEIYDLKCRPCSIHGGDKCPIDTFDCMKKITAEMVLNKAGAILR
jgi:heptosyltransferase-2